MGGDCIGGCGAAQQSVWRRLLSLFSGAGLSCAGSTLYGVGTETWGAGGAGAPSAGKEDRFADGGRGLHLAARRTVCRHPGCGYRPQRRLCERAGRGHAPSPQPARDRPAEGRCGFRLWAAATPGGGGSGECQPLPLFPHLCRPGRRRSLRLRRKRRLSRSLWRGNLYGEGHL